jgi:phytoene dehydrogenase-like protein
MLAHPFDDGSAVCVYRSLEQTAAALGADGAGYRALFRPYVENWPKLEEAVLGPLRWPRHPLALARFGRRALQPAATVARRAFAGRAGRALIAGMGRTR